MARRDSLRRFTDWLADLRHRFFGWITAPRAAALLLGVLGVLVGYGGYLYYYCDWQYCPNLVAGWEQLFKDYYANVSSSLVTITIAVLTIDWLNERQAERQRIEREQFAELQAEKQLKAQLIREMGHPTDNGVALRAVRELRAHGWLEDGSLRRAELRGANLHEVDLSCANLEEANLERADLEGAVLTGASLRNSDLGSANLQHAHLSKANLQSARLKKTNLHKAWLIDANLQRSHLIETNLQEAYLAGADLMNAAVFDIEMQGANLEGANLQGIDGLSDRVLTTVNHLIGATMRDGSRYDGRFNLEGDTRLNMDINGGSEAGIIDLFYGVSYENYLAGQEWARENLPRLRRAAGLEQEEAAETGDTKQPEEPQGSAPLLPVVTAQSLLSFTIGKLIGLLWPSWRS